MTKQENRYLVRRYPFLKPRKVGTGAVFENYDYTWTEMDRIPGAWFSEFGFKMVEELRTILLKADYLKEYRILYIGNELGCLCWFDQGYPKTIAADMKAWAAKYRKLSAYTCIDCGKPATHILPGWFTPHCEGCLNIMTDHPEDCPTLDEWYRQWIEGDADGLLYRKHPRELW